MNFKIFSQNFLTSNKIFFFLKLSSLTFLLVLVMMAMKYFKSNEFKSQLQDQQSSMGLLFGNPHPESYPAKIRFSNDKHNSSLPKK